MKDFTFDSAPTDEPAYSRPRWFEPPGDILGVVVPNEKIIARAPNVVIALTHVTAYPEGCVLATHVAGRQGDLPEDDWHALLDVAFRGGRSAFYPRSGGRPSDTVRRYAVRFADGRTATTLDQVTADKAPTGPLLSDRTGTGTADHTTFDHRTDLWLWPLPPPEPFELIVEWPAGRIPVTIAQIDGAPINEAASNAHPYWP